MMKIVNTSLYDSKNLKTLFCFIHTLMSKQEGRLSHWKSLQIKVMNKTKGNSYSGQACLGYVKHSTHSDQTDMWLSISKECSLHEIAQLFSHELMHSYGYNHHQFHTDPLTIEQIKIVDNQFNKHDLLSDKAFYIPKVGKSYKKMTHTLMNKYNWLLVDDISDIYCDGLLLEVEDARVDVEDLRYDLWHRAKSWKGAYDLSVWLITEKWQKEFTNNWTVNLGEYYE